MDEPSAILIPLTVLLPIFGALGLLVPAPAFDDRRTAWSYALLTSLATFVVSVLVAMQFDWSATGPQMARVIPWVPAFGLSFSFGLDAISLWLVLLSTFITPLVILATVNEPHETPGNARGFFFWLLLVEAAMVAAFVATDAIFFFLCFEFTLIPLYFLIGQFGGVRRKAAAATFFIYTFAGSMLMFAGLLYVGWFAAQQTGQWSFDFASLYAASESMTLTQQGWVLAAFLAGFAVKIPIFPVHSWLPLTYRESPVAGTVILAAVLAKLGTYGLLRFALPITPDAFVAAAPAIGTLAVIGILYAALIAWVQKDLKTLIAYSSISHLGFIVLGLFALDGEDLGAVGATIYMVNHGIATGALFLCAGMLFERVRTYEMAAVSGVARVMPVWAFFMVFFVFASVGLPGLNGFVGEFLTLIGTFNSPDGVLGRGYAVPAAFGIILSAIYLLYMTGRVVFGRVRLPLPAALPGEPPRRVPDLSGREIAALAPLALAAAFLGMYPAPVLESLEQPVAQLTESARGAAASERIVADDAGPDRSAAHVSRVAGTPPAAPLLLRAEER